MCSCHYGDSLCNDHRWIQKEACFTLTPMAVSGRIHPGDFEPHRAGEEAGRGSLGPFSFCRHSATARSKVFPRGLRAVAAFTPFPFFLPFPFPSPPGGSPAAALSWRPWGDAGGWSWLYPAEPPRRPSEPLGPCPPHGPLRPPPPASLGAATARRLPPQLLLPRREELSPPLAVSHRGRRAKERDEAPAAGWCGGDGRLEAGALLRRGRAGGAAPGEGPLRALFTCGRDHRPPLLLLLFTWRAGGALAAEPKSGAGSAQRGDLPPLTVLVKCPTCCGSGRSLHLRPVYPAGPAGRGDQAGLAGGDGAPLRPAGRAARLRRRPQPLAGTAAPRSSAGLRSGAHRPRPAGLPGGALPSGRAAVAAEVLSPLRARCPCGHAALRWEAAAAWAGVALERRAGGGALPALASLRPGLLPAGICLPGRGRRQGKGQQEKQLLQIKKGKEKIKRGSFVGHLQSSAPRQASESK